MEANTMTPDQIAPLTLLLESFTHNGIGSNSKIYMLPNLRKGCMIHVDIYFILYPFKFGRVALTSY